MNHLPEKLGRYELLELLATGGMAHIYRARLKTSGGVEKQLVIKRVLPHLVNNQDFIEMFVDEARITMPLNHGNIVQVFEFGQEGKDYFLAMEYVRGRNLEAIISRLRDTGRPMPIAVALFIASEVAKGLDYAHRFRDPHNRPTGIIHRDVSPQNILLGFQGEVKLTDFGIAKARSKIHQTSQGIIRGKAVYLSPEQAECKAVDGRSDQFSLASVLYEMLTGIRPFEGDTEVATLQKVGQANAPLASSMRPDISEELDHALAKAFALEPANRFDNCGAFQVALSRALANENPDFTSASIAEWLRELFSEEITHEIEQRTVRDRLLGQLAQNRKDSSSKNLSTEQILQMGTVSIRTDKDTPQSKKKPIAVLSIGLLSVLTIVGFGIWLLFGSKPPADPLTSYSTEINEYPDAGMTSMADSTTTSKHENDGGLQKADKYYQKSDKALNIATKSGDGKRRPDGPLHAKADSKIVAHKWAFLNINASPWAFVEIDGKRLSKETPIFKIKVSPGLHRLRFINPALKIDITRPIRVRPGQVKTVSVELNEKRH